MLSLKTGNFLKSFAKKAVFTIMPPIMIHHLRNAKKILSHWAEKERFRRCIKEGKPYFGLLMASNQGRLKRYECMQTIVRLECLYQDHTDYRVLEIGSWAGGSAITWAEALKKFNGRKGSVLCIDPWERFDMGGQLGVYEVMDRALSKGKIFQLFLHNIRASGYQDIIRWIRARSEDVLPLFKSDYFDLIYLDGRHIYEQVSSDLRNAIPLLRDGGILCGDDLELQLSSVDVEHAKVNARFDYILEPKSGEWFHPGVTLAVADWFGEVSAWHGFWAMRKRGQTWERVMIEEGVQQSFEKC